MSADPFASSDFRGLLYSDNCQVVEEIETQRTQRSSTSTSLKKKRNYGPLKTKRVFPPPFHRAIQSSNGFYPNSLITTENNLKNDNKPSEPKTNFADKKVTNVKQLLIIEFD